MTPAHEPTGCKAGKKKKRVLSVVRNEDIVLLSVLRPSALHLLFLEERCLDGETYMKDLIQLNPTAEWVIKAVQR